MDELLAHAVTKALAYAENGGAPNIDNPVAGKTGEMKSIFQFTPDTWKNYAKQVLNDENAELNADNETHVVNEKVKGWLSKGYKPEQIASMWNAGIGEPDAYTGTFSDGSPSKGTNKKYNVPFDVPSYAKKVAGYTEKFYNEKKGGQQAQQPQALQSVPQKAGGDPLQNIMSIMKQAKGTTEQKPKAASKGSGLIKGLIARKAS